MSNHPFNSAVGANALTSSGLFADPPPQVAHALWTRTVTCRRVHGRCHHLTRPRHLPWGHTRPPQRSLAPHLLSARGCAQHWRCRAMSHQHLLQAAVPSQVGGCLLAFRHSPLVRAAGACKIHECPYRSCDWCQRGRMAAQCHSSPTHANIKQHHTVVIYHLLTS